MQWFWDHYIDDKANRYSAINLDSENTNLPKTFIAVAECDILKSEAIDNFYIAIKICVEGIFVINRKI